MAARYQPVTEPLWLSSRLEECIHCQTYTKVFKHRNDHNSGCEECVQKALRENQSLQCSCSALLSYDVVQSRLDARRVSINIVSEDEANSLEPVDWYCICKAATAICLLTTGIIVAIDAWK